MDIATVGIIGMVMFIVLMFLNMPLGIILALVGFVGVGLIRGWDAGLSLLSVQAFRTGSDYVLGVVPLFVAMGYMAMRFRLSSDLFNVTNKWIGHWRGGIAMASTAACTSSSPRRSFRHASGPGRATRRCSRLKYRNRT